MSDEFLVQTLLDCIEKLLELLRTTIAKEQAEEIYKQFLGN